jgi:membrane associated rhomboid family serine protease
MTCRHARDAGATTCPVCSDALLDLSTETDRWFVRTALRSAVMAWAMVVAVAHVGVRGLTRGLESADSKFAWDLVGCLLLGGSVPVAGAVVLRQWGLRAADVRSDEELASGRRAAIQFLSGVPLWSALAVLAIHAARLSPDVDAVVRSFALTADEARTEIGLHALTYALVHADAPQVIIHAFGLLYFGHWVQLRVGRLGALALLVAGVIAGGACEGLAPIPGPTRIVGIHAGVAAWIAAPAVLDPKVRALSGFFWVRRPLPMWANTLAWLGFWWVLGLGDVPNATVLGSIGGAAAGLLVALPLRWVPPSPEYAAWCAATEQAAASLR